MKMNKREGAKVNGKIPSIPQSAESGFERSMVPISYEFFSPSRVFNAGFAPFDLRETEGGFTVSVAIPGFKENEIEVRAEPRRLFLYAKHEESAEKKGEHVFEEHKEFTRWVDFPAEVNVEKVTAVLSRGVLEVSLEKAKTAKEGRGSFESCVVRSMRARPHQWLRSLSPPRM